MLVFVQLIGLTVPPRDYWWLHFLIDHFRGERFCFGFWLHIYCPLVLHIGQLLLQDVQCLVLIIDHIAQLRKLIVELLGGGCQPEFLFQHIQPFQVAFDLG